MAERGSSPSAWLYLPADHLDPANAGNRVLVESVSRKLRFADRNDAQGLIERLTACLHDVHEREDKSELRMLRGVASYAAGEYEHADGDFQAAIRDAPDDWRPYFHRWQLNLKLQRSREAEQCRKAGAQIRPDLFSQNYPPHGVVI
ncbi:MAG: hypothetical protein KDA96_19945 [Planctomycetaceae bacterium]|nr:hypothetical protein [Planctomycetaceae bacterium]